MKNPIENQQKREPDSAENSALGSASARNEQPAPPDLAQVVTAWPTLPEAIRRAVLGLVNSQGV